MANKAFFAGLKLLIINRKLKRLSMLTNSTFIYEC